MFCFVFVFLLSLDPRPFFQSFFEVYAPRQPYAVSLIHLYVSSLVVFKFCSFGDVAFSEYSMYNSVSFPI